MPTGYTAAIDDGIDFKGFALLCARAFGATILMRDDPLDAPIPDEFATTDYHPKAVEAAKARKFDLERMSLKQVKAAAETANHETAEYWRRANDRRTALRAKYEAMLAQVEAWTPPTPDHEGMKKFMREQIEESIRFDCNPAIVPNPQPPGVWHAEQLAAADWDIAYHTKAYEEEVERCRLRTEWVRALRKSLEQSP
jgi:hypothetical protein